MVSLGSVRLGPGHHSLVTHPLGTAPTRHLHSPGAWAVPAGQTNILTAQWQAGEATIIAAAQDPAVGPEGLPVQVPASVHLTASILLFQEARGLLATRACPRLTNQALAGVADMQTVTGLSQPPRTHLTAATAIQHQGHPQWALGWCPRTSTGCWTQLGPHH